MAFPDPIQLKDSGAVVKDFTRRGPIANGNRYIEASASAAYSTHLDLRSLLVTPKGGADKYMRNIVTVGITRIDADDNAHVGTLSTSHVRPLVTDITDADMAHLYAYMADFWVAVSGGYKTRFQRGET